MDNEAKELFINNVIKEYDLLWNEVYNRKHNDRFVLWYEVEETTIFFFGQCRELLLQTSLLRRNAETHKIGGHAFITYDRSTANFQRLKTVLHNQEIEIVVVEDNKIL